MKVDRVILVSNNNRMYSDFWNNLSYTYKIKFGIQPTLVFFGTESEKEILGLSENYGNIIYEKKINATLIIVGKGDQTKRLKMLAKEQYVDQKIIWISYCKDIEELLKNMDIFCLTSYYEGFGLVLLEAISQKIPIIAAKVSAIPEIIKDNYSGVLYESNNHEKFLLGINKIMKSKSFKKKITSNSLVSLKNKFTIKKMTQQTQAVYGF